MSRATDQQVRRLNEEMAKHGQVGRAAMKADMNRTTARKYLRLKQFPSEMHTERTWKTRTDPFAADWPEIAARLTEANELEGKSLFEDLLRRRPGVYQEGQLRTFQRRVQVWQAQFGPDKEVFFPQDHVPGEAIQTDFTWATELGVTIQGELFAHLLCHVVLPYSNWGWLTVCQSESMLALRRGIPAALAQLGRIPRFSQTDNSTSATHKIAAGEEAEVEVTATGEEIATSPMPRRRTPAPCAAGTHSGRDSSPSGQEWGWVCRMLERGCRPEDVYRELVEKARGRRSEDAERYAKRTVDRAIAKVRGQSG